MTEKCTIYLLVILFCMGCTSKNDIKRVYGEEFDMEGEFIGESIPNGQIKYYLPKSNEIITTKEFKNGLLNGKSINYYKSIPIQIMNYRNGLEFGNGFIYDSAGAHLLQQDFYYHGKKMGPSYTHGRDGISTYEFLSFENEVLYSCEYDREKKERWCSDFEKLETITVMETEFNNQKRLRLFFYLINPPLSKTTYKVYYLDRQDIVLDSVQINASETDIFWEGSVDPAPENQNLALVITNYDSCSLRVRTMITYLKPSKK